MAIDKSNLNGSVNLIEPSTRAIWNSYNFRNSAFYERSLYLNNGDEDSTQRWWMTPLPYPPFNVRAPEELLNESEWRSLRNWLCDTVKGGWIDDIDFFNENQGFGTMTRKDNGVVTSVDASTGPTATSTSTIDGEYIVHTFTQSDYLNIKSEGIVEYLLVGGGGAGGGNYAGGGGGGGSVVTGFKRLGVGTYDIIVGAGGAGGDDVGAAVGGVRDGKDGGDTKAFGITAYGGGVGGGATSNSFAAIARVDGALQPTPFIVNNSVGIGSGGGGSAANTAGAVSSSHTKGSNAYGYRGGDGYISGSVASPIYLGGGGGGAGGRGVDAQAFQLSNVVATGTGGQFSCTSNPTALLAGPQLVCIVSGTNTGTGSITGYSNPTMYFLNTQTDGTFKLTVWSTNAAITTTAGTLTGLTFIVTTRQAGAGGIGVMSAITGSEVYYGGGGAGGCHGALDRGNVGGLGGGASSKDAAMGVSTSNAGTANRGGGGAGASGLVGVTGAAGGAGGAGVVIVRYPKGLEFGSRKGYGKQKINMYST
jgi:hypothetical protein